MKRSSKTPRRHASGRFAIMASFVLLICPHSKAGLLGYWALDETSGTVAPNSSVIGTDGTLYNGAAWINDAQRGQVLGFDGSNDYVDAGSIPAISSAGDFTWSFWTYNQQGLNNDVIVGNRWDGTGNGTASDGWIKFTTNRLEFSSHQAVPIDYADIAQNTWVHHALVKDGTMLTYFRDGVSSGTATATADTGALPFFLGGDREGERWQGQLDDVAIWSDALTSYQIEGLADGALTPMEVTTTFDLADALGGGDGSLPGTGGNGDIAATAGTYTISTNAIVDGTFVPNNTAGTVVIDGAGNTYDFDSQTSDVYYNPWRNGLNLDTDPSGDGITLPDFNGDPENHSLISAHANKGITFDLDAVRDLTGMTPTEFTAYIGDSAPKPGGSISYFVLVDGALEANRNSLTDDYDFITIPLNSSDRFLTLTISDANNGISSDHGYIGDPFLKLTPIVPEPSTSVVSGLLVLSLLARRHRRSPPPRNA